MKHRSYVLTITVAVLAIQSVFAAPQDFTIAVLPDTQHYTLKGGNGIFQQQVAWIVSNRIDRHIVCVVHVGDIVDKAANVSQWTVATNALYMLENTSLTHLADGIPYCPSVGNHDEEPKGDSKGTDAFNIYFGTNHFAAKKYNGGHYGSNRDNHYELFSAGGMDFLVLSVAFGAVSNVLAWADGVVKSHPARRVIVVTHSGLTLLGHLSDQGKALHKALKCNPNWFMLLCGHVHREARMENVYNGHTVYSLLADYQDGPNGGNGWLRLMTFSPSNNTISVETYSPYLDKYDTGASSAFTLKYDMQEKAEKK